jgi:hypothetical protein
MYRNNKTLRKMEEREKHIPRSGKDVLCGDSIVVVPSYF